MLNQKTRTASVLMVLALSVTCGCQTLVCWKPSWVAPWKRAKIQAPQTPPPPTYSVFAAPEFQLQPPQRVVMLPSGQSQGNFEVNRRAIDELASQLRQVGVFEVLVPRHERFHSPSDNLLQGSFDEREVAAISEYYNADAIAVVRVNELRPVVPLRTSMTMVIIDSHDSVVTFAVDGIWDSGNEGTHKQFQSYVEKHQALTGLANSTSGKHPPIELQSPTALFSFAASEVASAVKSSSR